MLRALDSERDYRLTKVEARRSAREVFKGDTVTGELSVLMAKERAAEGAQFNDDDFLVLVYRSLATFIRTSLVQSARRTEKGIEIRTLNSLYLLEELK